MSARVRLPDHDADRPGALSLVAVGVSALLVGLLLARGLRSLEAGSPATPAATAVASASSSERTERAIATAKAPDETSTTVVNGVLGETNSPAAPDVEPAAPNSEPLAREAVATDQTTPVPAEPSPPVSNATSASASPPPAEPSPVAPEPAPVVQVATALGPHEHNLKVGIVAYDRCEGLPQNPGRFPCPRDLALEQYVWRSLRGLEHCAVAKDALGSGEIKLEFAGSRLQSVRINKPKRDGLDRDVVSKCAGGALAAARTAFSPEQMLVRFRFELR